MNPALQLLSTVQTVVLALFLLSVGSLDASAATFFSDRANFEAQAPGLTMEDFSRDTSGDDPNSLAAGFVGPLSSTLNSVVYTPGDIEPGVNINDGALEALGYGRTGFFGITATDEFLFSNQNLDGIGLNFDFLPGVNAVGMDFFAENNIINNMMIDVFDTLGGALDSTVVVDSLSGVFFGVISSVEIGRIRIEAIRVDGGGRNVEVVDNLSFGLASTPEPGVGFLLTFGLLALRFRHRRE